MMISKTGSIANAWNGFQGVRGSVRREWVAEKRLTKPRIQQTCQSKTDQVNRMEKGTDLIPGQSRD